jgi:hypothetical protein
MCGTITINYKLGCLIALKFTPNDLFWHITMDSIMLDTRESLVVSSTDMAMASSLNI